MIIIAMPVTEVVRTMKTTRAKLQPARTVAVNKMRTSAVVVTVAE